MDRHNEAKVVVHLADRWKCEWIKNDDPYSLIDFIAVRNFRQVAFAEVKRRHCFVATYPTVYLSLRKWHALFEAHVRTGLSSVFVVQFDDGIKWIEAKDVDPRTAIMRGRFDREDAPNDVEPIIEVPIELFNDVRVAS